MSECCNSQIRWLDCRDCKDKRRLGKKANCIYICTKCGKECK